MQLFSFDEKGHVYAVQKKKREYIDASVSFTGGKK